MKVMREADMEGEEQKKNIEQERCLQQKHITYIYGNIIKHIYVIFKNYKYDCNQSLTGEDQLKKSKII